MRRCGRFRLVLDGVAGDAGHRRHRGFDAAAFRMRPWGGETASLAIGIPNNAMRAASWIEQRKMRGLEVGSRC